MVQKPTISIFIIPLFYVSLAVANDSDGHFVISSEKRLRVPTWYPNIVEKRIVNSMIGCSLLCARSVSCRSVNTKKNGPTTCELLSISGQDEGVVLEKDKDYDHIEIIKPCNDALCLNMGTCQISSPASFKCACAVGYQGENCERDVDECATDSDICGANAICKNTHGSYSCVSTRGLEKSTILSASKVYRSGYLQTLIDYLDPVLQDKTTSQWHLCWHANQNGWDVNAQFHRRCDGRGPTVTIVRVGSYVFGGYSDVSWNMNGQHMPSNRSFLYSLYNVRGFQPIKFNLTGKENSFAVAGRKDFGPGFGYRGDLFVSNNANTKEYSFSYPSTYDIPPGCAYRTSFCGFYTGKASMFTPSDVEVFFEMV